MRVIIANVPLRKVPSKDGKRTFHVQSAGLVGSDGLASRFDVWISDRDTPHQPGEYEIDHERSVYVDRQGNLAIRPVLVPVAPAAKPKA